MDEEKLARWRAHLPPHVEAFEWAAERSRQNGLDEIADGYEHVANVFYAGVPAPPASWTPLRVAVATLVLRHPPPFFVSAASPAMVVDFWLDALDPEAAVRGLWATRGLVTKMVSEFGASLTLLVPGKTRAGESPPLRHDVWIELRARLESVAPRFDLVDLWESSDAGSRALLAYLCPWQPTWALGEARDLVERSPTVTNRDEWRRRALLVVASLSDAEVVGALVNAMIRHHGDFSDDTRWIASLCRRGEDFIRALLPAADVDVRVLRTLLEFPGPVVVEYVANRALDPLRRVQGPSAAYLLAHRDGALAALEQRIDPVGRRLRAVLAAPADPELPAWASPTSLALAIDVDRARTIVAGLLAGVGTRAAVAKVTKGTPPEVRDRLAEIALELFERWRLFGGDPATEGILKTLGRLPSDAAADTLGELVTAIGHEPSAGDQSAKLEEERHRLAYVEVLGAMDSDRAVGWLGKLATDRQRPATVRSAAKKQLARAAKRRKTDVSGLPKLDGVSTAIARLVPSVRRAIDRDLDRGVRRIAPVLEDIELSCGDDTYEGRAEEIDRAWSELEPTLLALLPRDLPARDRKAVRDELCKRFGLACMEASPRWAD